MTWQERQHPRDPDGKFREKATGWVGQISDRIGLPSAKKLLQESEPNSDIAGLGREFEGRYGRGGGMIVSDVNIGRSGGDRPDMAFSPLGHLEISGAIMSDDDPDNEENGYFRITVTQDRDEKATDPLRWTAEIDRMHVRGDAQGGGGGRELTARFVDWFRRSGIEEVKVGPSEVGSYAWPAMGFDFADSESRQVAWEGALYLTVPRVRDWLDNAGRSYGMDGSGLTDKEIKKMIGQYRRAATLARAGGMSATRLSQYGRRKGQGKNDWWAGKLGLLVGGIGGGKIKL